MAGRLTGASAAEQIVDEIVGRYRDLRAKLPETARWRDSVVSQLELLANFYETPDRPGVGREVATRLRQIADALREASRNSP